jgi:YD repeat-containing protein
VQGRLVGKQYPDTSTVTYAYETTTSRLKSVTDAASQVKTYSYAKDDRLLGIAYTGAAQSQRHSEWCDRRFDASQVAFTVRKKFAKTRSAILTTVLDSIAL